MQHGFAAGLVALAVVVIGAALLGCESKSVERRALDRILPETRERMLLVMDKVGGYYRVLEADVTRGNLSEAAAGADAIAALGSYLGAHRDPAVPDRYVAQQARFNETARELAMAARLKTVHEVDQRFEELKTTCIDCHEVFQVSLPSAYRDLENHPKADNER